MKRGKDEDYIDFTTHSNSMNKPLITFYIFYLQRASLADKDMMEDTNSLAAKAASDSEENNCGKHNTIGAESPANSPPLPPATTIHTETTHHDQRDRESPAKNDSNNNNNNNNNSKPSEDNSKPPVEDTEGELPATVEKMVDEPKEEEQEEEDEKVDESVAVGPKAALDEMREKSPFASELIKNIRNSRNVLENNSHCELADQISDKNKEVSGKDRSQLDEIVKCKNKENFCSYHESDSPSVI